MALYNIMLAAIDLTDEADQVIQRAQELRAMHEADLILLHVVEPVGYAYGGDIPMDLTELQDQLLQKNNWRYSEESSISHQRTWWLRSDVRKQKYTGYAMNEMSIWRLSAVTGGTAFNCYWALPPTAFYTAPSAMSWPFASIRMTTRPLRH